MTMTYIFVILLNAINETGKQNLLRYAEKYKLDHIGALVGCDRIPAAAAVTTMEVTLSEEQDVAVIIPAGTRLRQEIRKVPDLPHVPSPEQTGMITL